jgi:hypothetical protein
MPSAIGSIFGGDQADAAKGAAGAQVEATKIATKAQQEMLDKSIGFSKESRDLARSDLQPFREAGAGEIDNLMDLIRDPNKQREFIENNPFFSALAEKSKTDILNNQSAKGKVGSGGTPEALQNSYLLLGNDLLQQSIGNRFNIATMGANAAAGQATATQQTAANVGNAYQNAGNAISDLATQAGNAKAAGMVGAANARTDAWNNIIKTGISIAAL